MNVDEQKILRQLINKIAEEQQNNQILQDTCSKVSGDAETSNSSIGSSIGSASDPRVQFPVVSSSGSIHKINYSSASSAHDSNSDDEDSDGFYKQPVSYKERRREAHSQAEQKRRDAIKKGYEELTALIPTCQGSDNNNASKFSKATILQKALEYIQWLISQNKKHQEEIDNLRKELEALQIMKENYEKIVIAHKKSAEHGSQLVPDDIKFQLFQQLMDYLFKSFNSSIMVGNFTSLSGSIFSWLEECCKPKFLKDFVGHLLGQTSNDKIL